MHPYWVWIVYPACCWNIHTADFWCCSSIAMQRILEGATPFVFRCVIGARSMSLPWNIPVMVCARVWPLVLLSWKMPSVLYTSPHKVFVGQWTVFWFSGVLLVQALPLNSPACFGSQALFLWHPFCRLGNSSRIVLVLFRSWWKSGVLVKVQGGLECVFFSSFEQKSRDTDNTLRWNSNEQVGLDKPWEGKDTRCSWPMCKRGDTVYHFTLANCKEVPRAKMVKQAEPTKIRCHQKGILTATWSGKCAVLCSWSMANLMTWSTTVMQNSSSNWFLRESFWSRLLPCCTTPTSWMMLGCRTKNWGRSWVKMPSEKFESFLFSFAFFWHVLCFFFEDMNYLVMPATHFFSLPDYIFQDLRTVVGGRTGIAWLMLM